MISQKKVSLILSVFIYFCYTLIPNQVRAIPQQSTINSSIIDYWTQHFFDLLRPELVAKSAINYNKLHLREQVAINQVVTYVLLSTCQDNEGDNYFLLAENPPLFDSAKYPRYRYQPRGLNRYLYNRERTPRLVLEDEDNLEKDVYWQLNRDYFFEGLYQDLTDAIFYTRHPEISREETKLQHLNWAAEWNFIRRHFSNYHQEKVLKQHFIPICQDFYHKN